MKTIAWAVMSALFSSLFLLEYLLLLSCSRHSHLRVAERRPTLLGENGSSLLQQT
jgi:hypothetical protein